MLISVTGTATLLYDLIDTAASSKGSKEYYGNQTSPGNGVANVVSLMAEDGDIRIAIGADPTAAKGFLIRKGTTVFYQGELTKLKLIRTSGSVSVSVALWTAVPGEVVTGFQQAVLA